MTPRPFEFILCIALASSCWRASAGDWDSEVERIASTRKIVVALRSEIQKKVKSEAVRSLDAQVKLSLGIAENKASPASLITSNGRTIYIPDVYTLKALNLARMTRVALQRANLNCVAVYRNHMNETGSTTGPEEFLKIAGIAGCESLGDAFPVGPMQEFMAERESMLTIQFAYLHELGHQFHNHVGALPLPPDVSTPENQCAFLRTVQLRRQLEEDADDFAITTALELGRPELVLGVIAQWVALIDGADSLMYQLIADHPVSSLRWARMVIRTVNGISKLGPQNVLLSTFAEDLKRWEQAALALVNESAKAFPTC